MDSIDVFDTAIFRDVYEPKDIFKLVEQQVGKQFVTKRREAESKAHKKWGYPTLKQIYENLIGFNQNIEINMEKEHVYANPKILEMYNKNPENYVFISDMYLPSKIITELLVKCGYKNPRVFVSCEEKARKSDGTLFEKVSKKIGKINKHYGDNYKCDIEGCIKHGIIPIFEDALQNLNLKLPAVRSSMVKKYAALIERDVKDPIEKISKYAAPLIYGFTKWVLDKRKDPKQAIYFSSRDMFMPYIIAKMILKAPNVHYLYCSRRSLAPLSIASGEKGLKRITGLVLTEEEYRQKSKDKVSCLNYLKKVGIKNGDFIVDIGYAGTVQGVIEKSLNIKLNGLYIELDPEKDRRVPNMKMEMFLQRKILKSRFFIEFILCSPEDCIEGYTQDGTVITTPDIEDRKPYAKRINEVILNLDLLNHLEKIDTTIFDIEQLLIHLQNNPTKEIMEIFNKPMFINRLTGERGVNYDREKIQSGDLIDCYNRSYAKNWFKLMLMNDPELNGLSKFLPE